MRMRCAALTLVTAMALPLAPAWGQERGKATGKSPDEAGLYNVAQTSLGATAKGMGSPFNKDWPANNAIGPEGRRAGTIFGGPLKGGRVDIRLVIPVDIQAVEVVGLDYHGTMVPKAIDIFIEGKLAKHADLPETPGKPYRIPVAGKGQMVGVLVTEDYPIRTLPDGKKGPAWAGGSASASSPPRMWPP